MADRQRFQNTGHGWWNESQVAATVRTPCGGDSVKANLVLEPIVFRDDITIKIDEDDVAFTLGARDFKGVQCVSYQTTTGTLSPGGHPGSYNGQDAYNDMLVIDDGSNVHRERSGRPTQAEPTGGCAELYARPTGNNNNRRGGGVKC